MPSAPRAILISLSLLAVTVEAAAQGEIDAALKLARKGRKEEAEAILKKLLDGKPAPQARAEAELVRAEILRAEADAEPDLTKSQALLDASADLLRDYLRDTPLSIRSAEARRGLDWRLHRKADRAARAVRAEPDPQKQALLRRGAEDLYDALERHYKERARSSAQGGRGAEDETMEVLLDLARSWIERAKLVSTDDQARKRILGDAIARLQDFQFDYFDSEMSFEALLLEGQCHALLGDAAAARDRFAGAASLKKRLEESGASPGSYHESIVRTAWFSLTESCFETGEPRQVLALVDGAFAEDPDLASGPAGHPLRLQKAEALFQLGDLGAAHALATEVIHGDPDGRLAAAAKEKLRLWSQGSATPGGVMTPERLLLTVESKMDAEEWQRAVETLRLCVEASSGPEERARFEPEAFHKMGQCFQKLERHHEAAFAFERVFLRHPGSDLAPRACFEAALSLGAEFDRTSDPEDEGLKEKLLALLLEKWPQHPATRNVAFLQAKKLERAKHYGEAAEKYLSIPPEAEAYESALIEAARCRAREASALEGEAAREEARALLANGEEALGKFFARASEPRFAPRGPVEVKARARLAFEATRELALIQSHEASGKNEEALRMLEAYAAGLKPDDPRMPEVLALEVRPLLALGKVSEAAGVLDSLIARFPKSRAVRPAARAAALRLQEVADAMIAAKEDQRTIATNLKLIDRYAAVWLATGPDRTRFRAEALRASETLWANALRLNGIDDGAASLADTDAAAVTDPEPVANAAALNASLADGKFGPLSDEERIAVLSRLCRARASIARGAEDLDRVREIYERIIKESKLIGAGKQVSREALGSTRGLLRLYMDYGRLLFEMGRKGQAAPYEKALEVFESVVSASEAGSEPWWIARYMTLVIRAERGAPNDAQYARVMFENLEKNNPDFDADRFGMRARLLELKTKVLRGGGS